MSVVSKGKFSWAFSAKLGTTPYFSVTILQQKNGRYCYCLWPKWPLTCLTADVQYILKNISCSVATCDSREHKETQCKKLYTILASSLSVSERKPFTSSTLYFCQGRFNFEPSDLWLRAIKKFLEFTQVELLTKAVLVINEGIMIQYCCES